jgi:hypothetical protein
MRVLGASPSQPTTATCSFGQRGDTPLRPAEALVQTGPSITSLPFDRVPRMSRVRPGPELR